MLAARAAAPGARAAPATCPTTPGSGRPCRRASGGTWGGCVYDVDAIADLLAEGLAARAARDGGSP